MQYSTSEFETLYNRCFPPSMRMAMSLLHEEDEARDTVQEVFLRLWESDSRVDNPEAFIIRAVRNACLNRIDRMATREKVCRRIMIEHTPAEYDPEQREEDLRRAICLLLTPREQQTVTKIYTEGLSYKDAASSLGISVAAVNKNIVGALKKLRTHFKSAAI